MKQRLCILSAALWWGSMTALGFIVVPMLFSNLGSPAIAGPMAAKLFSAQTWLSIGCAMLMLLASTKKDDAAFAALMKPVLKFVVAGLLLALLVEFGVSPRIANGRAEGANLPFWHGLGTAMYFAQWLCAALSLWRLSAGVARPAAATPV